MAQFFDTSFAVDPETGANQRSFVGVSMVPLEPLQTLMKTHVCRNSYMRHSDLKSGVVFTTQIHHLFEQHMRLKITAQDKTDLADYLHESACS
jgi:hypothetical protein